MANQDSLPTEEQRLALCEVLSYAMIEIRRLGWSGEAKQAGDLADVFHELPREMYGWGGFSWERLRLFTARYQEKYTGNHFVDFLAMLDNIQSPI